MIIIPVHIRVFAYVRTRFHADLLRSSGTSCVSICTVNGSFWCTSDSEQSHDTLPKVVVLEYVDDRINGTVWVVQTETNHKFQRVYFEWQPRNGKVKNHHLTVCCTDLDTIQKNINSATVGYWTLHCCLSGWRIIIWRGPTVIRNTNDTITISLTMLRLTPDVIDFEVAGVALILLSFIIIWM